MHYTVTERTILCRASQQAFDEPDCLALPDEAFEAVKQLATIDPDAEGMFAYTYQRGRERIKLRTYVGLLELRNGTAFDIHPRTGHLPTLLRHLTDPPFRYVDTGHSGATPMPMWEVFIDVFLRETRQALSRGLARAYVTHDADVAVVRGKLRLADQLRRTHADQLAVSYDDHTPDIAPNQLLKLALLHVQGRTRRTAQQTRCRQLLARLADVTVPPTAQATMQALGGQPNRLMQGYVPALRWASWLLGGKGSGVCPGAHVTTCLLFPMERVFEQYVAAGFRRVGAEVQTSSAHLIDEHEGLPKFKLRPDLLLRRAAFGRDDQTIVLDTKWKTLNPHDPGGHYGIEQSDLYQLYAYGKKYNATELVLIYPAHEQFTEPLRVFGFDSTLRLHVVPFDLDKPLMEEVEKVLKQVGNG